MHLTLPPNFIESVRKVGIAMVIKINNNYLILFSIQFKAKWYAPRCFISLIQDTRKITSMVYLLILDNILLNITL